MISAEVHDVSIAAAGTDRRTGSGHLSLCPAGRARAFLCGRDPVTGKDYGHRKDLIQKRFEFPAGVNFVEVLSFAVMTNHLHIVLRNRPDRVQGWSDDEVARRWWFLFTGRKDEAGQPVSPRKATCTCRWPMRKAGRSAVGGCRACPGSCVRWPSRLPGGPRRRSAVRLGGSTTGAGHGRTGPGSRGSG